MLLASNNMPLNADVLGLYPEVMEFAKGIIKGERNSRMEDKSAERVSKARNLYERRNEDTYMKKVWPKLIRDERDRQVQEGTDLIPAAWKKTTWEEDDLDEAWNQPFEKGSIPKVDTSGDKTWATLLNRNQRIKNPKPDILYGLSKNPFTPGGQRANELYKRQAGISKGMWHPFALVEAKTSGTTEIVKCQSARGGAALVSAIRHLLSESGHDITTPGADTKSVVFSVSLVPTLATLSIHWAEVLPKEKGGHTIYHMHTVNAYAMEVTENSRNFRHDFDNVLDWGVLTRKWWVVDMMTTINARIQAGHIPNQITGTIAKDGEESEGEDDAEAAVEQSGSPSKKRKAGES